MNGYSATAHKKGRQIIFKPNDVYSALAIQEAKEFLKLKIKSDGCVFRTSLFGGHPKPITTVKVDKDNKPFRISITSIIEKMLIEEKMADPSVIIQNNPYVSILKTYNIDLTISPQLINFINKEARRTKLEATYYPTPFVDSDLPLFNRCVVGTSLLCIKQFKTPSGNVAFNKNSRYLVVDVGEETDKISISTNPTYDGAVISTGKGARIDWTEFDAPLEEYFTDTDSLEETKTVKELYPARIEAMAKKLTTLGFDVFDHTAEDAVQEVLKRGVMNCKIQRLGKSREAITIALLAGSQKVAIVTTKNIRLFWQREFKKIGITDYVVVNKLKDLQKKAKFYLLTYTFLRSVDDPFYKLKKDHKNYLKKSTKQVLVAVPGYTSKKKVKHIDLANSCPHCKGELVRRVKHTDGLGNNFFEWTTSRGYICINKECKPITDNRKCKGAAWQSNKLISHKAGSYVDPYLALHSHCNEDNIKGRICHQCKTPDSVWKPPMYKRVSKKFTMVIADEIHNAKDRTTQTAAGIFNIRAKRKIGLTGTPMSNSPMDVYYIMEWIFGGNSYNFPYRGKEGFKKFEDKFCQHVYIEKLTDEYDEKGKRISKIIKKRQPFLSNPAEFWRFISAKVVRRTYTDKLYIQSLENAGLKLPKSEIKKFPCDMNPEQTQLMISAVQDFKKIYEDIQTKAEKDKSEINEALIITKMSLLRTIATAPERLNERFGTEVYKGSPGGGKLPNILKLVKEKISKGEKVLILSDFIDMQKACESVMHEFGAIRFQTNWNDETRDKAFQSFAEDKNKKVFIAGTKAIREGVDLSAASSVICCDLLWSPAFQAQAWSRTLAPTKIARECDIYLAVSRHSLDEHIFNVFYSKMTAAEQAFDRKTITSRAKVVDIREFVDNVLNSALQLNLDVRDFDAGVIYAPTLNLMEFEERF